MGQGSRACVVCTVSETQGKVLLLGGATSRALLWSLEVGMHKACASPAAPLTTVCCGVCCCVQARRNRQSRFTRRRPPWPSKQPISVATARLLSAQAPSTVRDSSMHSTAAACGTAGLSADDSGAPIWCNSCASATRQSCSAAKNHVGCGGGCCSSCCVGW